MLILMYKIKDLSFKNYDGLPYLDLLENPSLSEYLMPSDHL